MPSEATSGEVRRSWRANGWVPRAPVLVMSSSPFLTLPSVTPSCFLLTSFHICTEGTMRILAWLWLSTGTAPRAPRPQRLQAAFHYPVSVSRHPVPRWEWERGTAEASKGNRATSLGKVFFTRLTTSLTSLPSLSPAAAAWACPGPTIPAGRPSEDGLTFAVPQVTGCLEQGQ